MPWPKSHAKGHIANIGNSIVIETKSEVDQVEGLVNWFSSSTNH